MRVRVIPVLLACTFAIAPAAAGPVAADLAGVWERAGGGRLTVSRTPAGWTLAGGGHDWTCDVPGGTTLSCWRYPGANEVSGRDPNTGEAMPEWARLMATAPDTSQRLRWTIRLSLSERSSMLGGLCKLTLDGYYFLGDVAWNEEKPAGGPPKRTVHAAEGGRPIPVTYQKSGEPKEC